MRPWCICSIMLGMCIAARADEMVSVDAALHGWSERADLKSLDASIAIKQLNKDRQWESDEPTFGRFRYKSSPLEARFDIFGLKGSSFLLTADGQLSESSAGQLRDRKQLEHNARLRTNLWLGDLPAFLLVGIDPEKMRYQFNIRVIPSSAGSISVYLYPQLVADQRRFDRLEVELAKETMLPVQIHIVWKDGRHTFMAITEPKTNVALDPGSFNLK